MSRNNLCYLILILITTINLNSRSAAKVIVRDGIENKRAEQQLREAARYGDAFRVKELIESSRRSSILSGTARLNIDAVDEFGFTALIEASQPLDLNKDMIQLLIELRADVNATTINGSTALMAIASRGNTDIVKLLIKSGADVNAVDRNGNTALICASNARDPNIVQLLLFAEANFFIKGEKAIDIMRQRNWQEPLEKMNSKEKIIKLLEAESARRAKKRKERQEAIKTITHACPCLHSVLWDTISEYISENYEEIPEPERKIILPEIARSTIEKKSYKNKCVIS